MPWFMQHVARYAHQMYTKHTWHEYVSPAGKPSHQTTLDSCTEATPCSHSLVMQMDSSASRVDDSSFLV